MSSFTLVTLGAALPSVMLVYLVQQLDRFREPVGHVVMAFIIGVLSPLVTLMISGLMPELAQDVHPWYYALSAAAIPEEAGRALLLYWVCTRWDEVGEPFDCIVYGVAIWAGFAATENVLYAAQEIKEGVDPIWVLSLRASLCTIGHSAWGLIMGAYVGIARFGKGDHSWPFLRGLLVTITLHMLYDGLLFSAQMDHPVVNTLLAIGVDALSVVLALLFLIRARALQDASDHEGHRSLLQSELLKRHSPDSAVGLYELVSEMHLMGVLKTLMAMVFSSLSVGSALSALSVLIDFIGSEAPIVSVLSFMVIAFVSGAIGFRLWRGVLEIAFEVHQQTEGELSADIDHAVKHDALAPERVRG